MNKASTLQRIGIPVAIISVAAFNFWYFTYKNSVHSQKWGSNLFKGIMYHVRQNEQVNHALGTPIKYNKDDRKINGDINMIKGRADIEFPITGLKAEGVVVFKGNKINEGNQWKSEVFQLKLKNSTTTIDL